MSSYSFEIARLSLVSTAIVGVLTSPALAQAEARQFDIPAQPLAAALLEFSRQSDVLIMVSPDLTSGKRSSALNATLPTNVAISQLLRGTDLEAIPNPKGGYRVERIDPGRLLAAVRPPRPAAKAAHCL